MLCLNKSHGSVCLPYGSKLNETCEFQALTRKILGTGSVSTENLQQKSHNLAKKERRVLAYKDDVDEPCSSASLSAVLTPAELEIKCVENL